MSFSQGNEEARMDINIYMKVVEAKEVKSGEFDSFSLMKLEGREVFRTRTIFNSSNPLWDEEYLANLHEPLKDIEVVLWEVKGRMFPDQPLGKIYLSRDTIQGNPGVLHERWLPLLPADTEGTVSGDIKMEILLTEKSLKINLHTGQNLTAADVNGFSDPYVVFQLLPTADHPVEHRSKIKKKTLNPKYDEQFEFEIGTVTPDHELLVTVWDWDRFTEDDFLGHFVIQLSALPLGKKVTDIYALRPKPPQLSLLMRKASVVNVQEEDPGKSSSSKPGAFARALEQLPREPDTPATSLGSVRVKFKYSEDIVLPESRYAELMEVVAAENFLLPVIFGRVSNEREDAAWALVKYFQHFGEATLFLSAIVDHEVETTADAHTIFRGNSMSSKSVDVYMKLTSLSYLQATIGDHIKEIITSKKNLELDPTRLDSKSDDVKKNWKNAKATVNGILDSIFKSKDKVPPGLSGVFASLRQSVIKKWPQDDTVPYTSVAGFIFLRLFVAAILNPNLFGLWDEIPDQKSSRNLTIVAKTVQNVANLVTFGQKEAFLEEMNDVIKARIPEMKKFIEDISVKKEEPRKSKGGNTLSKFLTKRKDKAEKTAPSKFLKTFVEHDVAKECAKIYHYFMKSSDKIIEEIQKENLKTTLGDTLLKQLAILKVAHEEARGNAPLPPSIVKPGLEAMFTPKEEESSPASSSAPPPPAPTSAPAPPPIAPIVVTPAPPHPPPPPSPMSLAPPHAGTRSPITDVNPRFIRSFTAESMASLDNIKVDFTQVEMSKLTDEFDPKYSFDYFDRSSSGSIPIKDFHLILNAQGVLPGSAEVQTAFKKAKISQNPNDLIDFATYQSVLSSLSLGPPKKETTADAVRFVSEFFGKDPSKGIISLEQMNKMMGMGEGKLTTAQLNHIATLSATSGAERGGQVNLSALTSMT